MVKNRAIIFFFFFSAFFLTNLFAQTIELKNGRKIYCDIIRQDDNNIVVSLAGGSMVMTLARADIYAMRSSTVDENQKRHTLETNPGQFAMKGLDTSLQNVNAKKNKQESQKDDDSANESNNGQGKIKFYSTPACHYCVLAKEYFSSKGIAFESIDIAKNSQKAQEMFKLSGQRGVPVIVINGQVIVGFNKAKIEKLLANSQE